MNVLGLKEFLVAKPMSDEHFEAFLEVVKSDKGLQGKLEAAVDSDAVLIIAQDAGFKISSHSASLIKNAQSGQKEISDEELLGVAGGDSNTATRAWRNENSSWWDIF